MKFHEDIKLSNRDGYNLFLKFIDDNTCILAGDTFPLEYVSVQYLENYELYSIDPVGGPFIKCSSELETDTEIIVITDIQYINFENSSAFMFKVKINKKQ